MWLRIKKFSVPDHFLKLSWSVGLANVCAELLVTAIIDLSPQRLRLGHRKEMFVAALAKIVTFPRDWNFNTLLLEGYY